MKENKGKGVANGIESEEDVQVLDDVTPVVVQKPGVQAGKRKGISSSVDLGDLLTRRGSKKQKSDKTPPPKVPKFPSATVHLDASAMNLVSQTTPSVQTTPLVQPDDPTPPTAKAPHSAHPLEKGKRPPNLVSDEGYAWEMFKGLNTDNEVNSCYNMLVRDLNVLPSMTSSRYAVFIIFLLFSKRFKENF